MAKEIERKFLVDLAHWPNETKGAHFEQGYIAITDSGIVRVRIIRDEVSTFCLLYTSPSPRDRQKSRMPSSA